MAKKTPARQASSGGKAGGKAPEVSRKVLRSASAPYERKGEDGKGEDGKGEDPKQEASEAAAKPGEQSSKSEVAGEAPKSKPVEVASKIAVKAEAKVEAKPEAKVEAKPEAKVEAKPEAKVEAKPEVESPAAAQRSPELADEAAPGRSSAPANAPADAPVAPPADALVEAPPAMRDAVPESEYAELLPPRAIDAWDPESPAPPPGKAPPGDSRSFRRYQDGVELFVLVYRHESFLITRAGKVGQQGKWTVVEYPTIGMAAHAYAQEGSRLTAEGYRDLR